MAAEQKCDIATRELDELHEEMERKKDDWEKQLDCHHAVIEEAKQRMDEIKKHQYEFERDVCRGGVDSVSIFMAFSAYCNKFPSYDIAVSHLQRTGDVQAERVVKFFEDGIRSRVGVFVPSLVCNKNDL